MEADRTNTEQSPVFQIQRYYIKQLNCKAPSVPAIFKEQGNPTSSMELQVKHSLVEADHFEVVMYMQINTKLNERTAYMVDIEQAGIFKLQGFAEQQLLHLLKAYCPSLLYPYLCKAIADITTQAGFPPLLLSPINFEQLYLQEQAKTNKDNNSNTAHVSPEINEVVPATVM